jgi:hypothetical protein
MTDRTAEWRVPIGDATVRAVHEPAAAGEARGTFVFAHGAGGHSTDRGMNALASALRHVGLDIVRFDFPYRERGSGRPDAMPLLMDAVAAVAARVRRELSPGRLLLGGRSMGGRAASMLAAESFATDGLLLFAYPLHPAGKPEKLRDAHLASIAVPVLCFNGTRDALCRQDLMDQVVARLPRTWTMRWLEGADHSFHVLKSSGRSDADVLEEIAENTAAWLAAGATRS